MSSVPELVETESARERTILMPNVEEVALSYFGKKRSDRAAAWHDTWTAEPGLPRLVRVTVRLPAGDTRLWPDLITSPRITADVGCIHDPLTKRCRGR